MKKKLILILLSIVVLIFSYNIIGQIANALRAEGRFQDTIEKLHKLEVKNKELKSKLDEIKTPEFIEKEARNKLGLTKEGETLVIIPQEKIDAVLGLTKKIEEIKLPNWLGWFKVFFK